MSALRIGFGYDLHRLELGRKLILGGVRIEYTAGLVGHSDADCLTHAITDAILGAAGLGDIGQHFPDTDPSFKDIDSQILLGKAYELVQKNNYKIVNIDSTIIAEKPKLATYIPNMQEALARTLQIEKSDIGIKATTNETVGPVGECKAIAAYAVCLLQK